MERRPVWPVFVTFGVATLAILVANAVLFLLRFGVEGVQHLPPLDATTLNISALVTALALLPAALLVARPFTRARLRLHAGGARPFHFLVVTIGGLALGDVLDSAVMLLGLQQGGSLAAIRHAIEAAAGPALVATFLVVGVLPGFVEELFFRGFMQTRLSERWRPWTAVLITSLCFGLLHMDLVHSTEAFLIGLWLGHATERTNSLWPAVVAHATNNTLGVAFQSLGLVTESPLANVVWGLIGVVLLVPCVLVMRRRQPPAVPAVPVAAAS